MPRKPRAEQPALADELEGEKYLGHPVEERKLKVVGASALDLNGTDYEIGNVVRITMEGVITADTHNVATRGDRDGGRQYVRKTLTFKADSEPEVALLAESRVIVGSSEDDPTDE